LLIGSAQAAFESEFQNTYSSNYYGNANNVSSAYLAIVPKYTFSKFYNSGKYFFSGETNAQYKSSFEPEQLEEFSIGQKLALVRRHSSKLKSSISFAYDFNKKQEELFNFGIDEWDRYSVRSHLLSLNPQVKFQRKSSDIVLSLKLARDWYQDKTPGAFDLFGLQQRDYLEDAWTLGPTISFVQYLDKSYENTLELSLSNHFVLHTDRKALYTEGVSSVDEAFPTARFLNNEVAVALKQSFGLMTLTPRISTALDLDMRTRAEDKWVFAAALPAEIKFSSFVKAVAAVEWSHDRYQYWRADPALEASSSNLYRKSKLKSLLGVDLSLGGGGLLKLAYTWQKQISSSNLEKFSENRFQMNWTRVF